MNAQSYLNKAIHFNTSIFKLLYVLVFRVCVKVENYFTVLNNNDIFFEDKYFASK